jgi:hypothetical protein
MSGGRRPFTPEQLAERVAHIASLKQGLREAVADAEIVTLRRGGHPGVPPTPVPVAAAPNIEPVTDIRQDLPPLTVPGPTKADRDQPNPVEAAVQKDVLAALDAHPAVAWVARMNVVRKGHIQGGFVGLSDIIGQLHTGQFLAIEVKRRWTNPTQAQIEFLGRVERSGGVAFVARGGADVWRALGTGRDAA